MDLWAQAWIMGEMKVKCLFDECLDIIVEIKVNGFNHLKVYNFILLRHWLSQVAREG